MTVRIQICHFSLLFLVIGLWACDVEDCISTKTSYMGVQFYNTEKDTFYTAKSITIFPIGSGYAGKIDTTFNAIGFPLNPSADSTQFVFNIQVEEEVDDSTFLVSHDSLYFDVKYTRRQRVISVECGVEQAYYGLELTNYNFDKIEMITDTVDRLKPLNVKVYF